MTTRSLIIAAAVILAFGLAMYLGQVWPLKALAWAENIAPVIVESKALAKVVLIFGTATGMLWATFAARSK